MRLDEYHRSHGRGADDSGRSPPNPTAVWSCTAIYSTGAPPGYCVWHVPTGPFCRILITARVSSPRDKK